MIIKNNNKRNGWMIASFSAIIHFIDEIEW